jgi:hypothetical protein
MCGEEHVGPRGEIGMPRVRCLPRPGLLMRQRGETPARKEMRGRMAGSTAQGSRQRDPHSYERRRTQGPGPRRRVGMHGAALVRIPNPFAKSEAVPSRPFLCLRLRLCSAEPAGGARLVAPAGCAGVLFAIGDSRSASRPPCTRAVVLAGGARQNFHPGRANLRDPGPRAAGVCGCGAFGGFYAGSRIDLQLRLRSSGMTRTRSHFVRG